IQVGARRETFPSLLQRHVKTSSGQGAAPASRRGDLDQWLARVRQWDWPTIWLVLGIKVLVLTFGVQAVVSLAPSHRGWLEIWNEWDAVHYLNLAKNGYVAAGDARVSLVFFPLYPWLVRLMAFVVRDYLVAALIVSGLASIAAALLLKRL